MDVGIDQTRDEGLPGPVDHATASGQGLSHLADAFDAAVANNDGPAALD